MSQVTAHFVRFFHPGVICADSSDKPISSWNVSEARDMAGDYTHGFCFVTRGREANELDSREIKRSGMYYLGGTVRTLADIERQADPKDSILLSNMKCNGYSRVLRTRFGNTFPLSETDEVLY